MGYGGQLTRFGITTRLRRHLNVGSDWEKAKTQTEV
jgi:hypothetical protein